MTISKKIEGFISKSSWIREMFEEGTRLKAEHGAENVFDFSLGNPNLPPPDKFSEVLRETVDSCGLGDHCYMPNTGYPMVCGSVADYLAEGGVLSTQKLNRIVRTVSRFHERKRRDRGYGTLRRACTARPGMSRQETGPCPRKPGFCLLALGKAPVSWYSSREEELQ